MFPLAHGLRTICPSIEPVKQVVGTYAHSGKKSLQCTQKIRLDYRGIPCWSEKNSVDGLLRFILGNRIESGLFRMRRLLGMSMFAFGLEIENAYSYQLVAVKPVDNAFLGQG